MKNVTLKIIISIVCCSFFITFILSGTAMTKTREVMQYEVEKELLYAVQKYANQFSRDLETHENVADMISVVVEGDFTTEDYKNNRELIVDKQKKLSLMIKDSMVKIPEIKSLYFTFNPQTSGGNDEIWYLRNASGEVWYAEADNTVEEWLVDGNEDSKYYFNALKNGRNWSGVEYDMYLDNYSLTYSRACYDKNGQLIGVVGTDFFVYDIFEAVKNIQLEEGGYSFLMDKDYNYLVGSKPEAFFNELRKSKVLDFSDDGILSDENSVSYSTVSGERYLTTYGVTSNGWILAIVQNEKNLMLPIKYMKQMLYTMAGLILIGVVVYAFYFSRNSVMPIVREYEQKDIILMHQSRQAKLGEMVGNIAHQWKQPLNVINIALSNLWDDYINGQLSEENLKKQIEDMRMHIKNMSVTVDDFADFLKPARKVETFKINEAIETSLGLMAESLRLNRIAVKFEKGEELLASGYRSEFCQGIFNILNNARDAIIESNPEKREITINTGTRTDEKNKTCKYIEITNKGHNIPEEMLHMLFTPYYTTKEASGGTGIGLYLTKEIVEAHMKGNIKIFNTKDGVCCSITIPGGIEA